MKLQVYFDNTLAGTLEKIRKDEQDQYVFRYVEDYLEKRGARPVSVNLPLTSEPFRSSVLFPFFDNLLAEGWLLDVQASTHKIDRHDKFALISVCGLECMGAVSLRGDQDDSVS